MTSILSVNGLTKTFASNTFVVNQVSFDVFSGEIICLLGPSGCGKTTLLRLIAGLEKPDAGQVRFKDRDLRSVPPHKRGFGMMFQDFALFPHKNVFENIAFGLRMQGWSQADIKVRVAEMLDLVDLKGFAERDVSRLSGGEQQRVALARSLAPDPSLLMLDEPLGALDRALRERLMRQVRHILKQIGVTAIYVTHDQTEAFAIADRIAIMNAGQIEQLALPQILIEQPASAFVARFLGYQNILSGPVLPSNLVETEIGPLKVDDALPEPGQAVTLLVKPEAITWPERPEVRSQLNRFDLTITDLVFRGRYYQLWGQIAGTSLMFELPDAPDSAPGEMVPISLDPSKIIIIRENHA